MSGLSRGKTEDSQRTYSLILNNSFLLVACISLPDRSARANNSDRASVSFAFKICIAINQVVSGIEHRHPPYSDCRLAREFLQLVLD